MTKDLATLNFVKPVFMIPVAQRLFSNSPFNLFWKVISVRDTEAYLGLPQKSKMENFAII